MCMVITTTATTCVLSISALISVTRVTVRIQGLKLEGMLIDQTQLWTLFEAYLELHHHGN